MGRSDALNLLPPPEGSWEAARRLPISTSLANPMSSLRSLSSALIAASAFAAALAAQAQSGPTQPAASARSAGAAAQPERPPVIRMAVSQGLSVHKSFEGPSGLTGWVLVRRQGEPLLVFTTADGKTLLSGAAVSDKGENLVEALSKEHFPRTDYERFRKRLGQAPAILQGPALGKSVVYAFFDPVCPYCNAAYAALKPLAETGLQVRWIPVAYLNTRSTGQAAALLQAGDPSAALAEHEQKFSGGGIASVTPSAGVKQSLDSNLALFREMGFKGVPALLFSGPSGDLEVINGAPQPADLARLRRQLESQR